MAIDYSLCAIPKPVSRKTVKGRKLRARFKNTHDVRAYVFARERDLCRICRFRPADSMHELRQRSLRGKVSRQNSVAVCGSGTTGCHAFAQGHAIRYAFEHDGLGAEGTVTFTPVTEPAAEWMRLSVGESLVSPVMVSVEMEL